MITMRQEPFQLGAMPFFFFLTEGTFTGFVRKALAPAFMA